MHSYMRMLINRVILFQMTSKTHKTFIQIASKVLIFSKITKIDPWHETLFSDPHHKPPADEAFAPRLPPVIK